MTGIKPRTARVVIYQGDDLARLSDLDEKVTRAEVALRMAERKAKDSSGPALLDETETPEAAVIEAREAHEEAVLERNLFAEEAEARGVALVLHQVGRKEWRRLRNSHPAREGNAEDEMFDCNVDSMPDEALPKSICRDSDCPVCRESAQRTTVEGDLEAFLDSLSSHDYYQRLFMTMLALNVGGATADPKLRVGSESNPTSSAT